MVDLLAVQGTLKSLLQHHSSKASILQRPDFFIVQLSHPHMTTGKTMALTRQTFVGKVMSLLLNMLSRLIRSHLFIFVFISVALETAPSLSYLRRMNVCGRQGRVGILNIFNWLFKNGK